MNTTPPNILDQLAAAWALPEPIKPGPIKPGPTDPAPITGAPAPQKPVEPAPVRLERATPICRWHVPPFDLIDADDRARPGYVRSACRACGRFIGYRRADK